MLFSLGKSVLSECLKPSTKWNRFEVFKLIPVANFCLDQLVKNTFEIFSNLRLSLKLEGFADVELAKGTKDVLSVPASNLLVAPVEARILGFIRLRGLHYRRGLRCFIHNQFQNIVIISALFVLKIQFRRFLS